MRAFLEASFCENKWIYNLSWADEQISEIALQLSSLLVNNKHRFLRISLLKSFSLKQLIVSGTSPGAFMLYTVFYKFHYYAFTRRY